MHTRAAIATCKMHRKRYTSSKAIKQSGGIVRTAEAVWRASIGKGRDRIRTREGVS